MRDLMLTCLADNDRRLAGYDPRFKQPTTMPRLVQLVVRLLRN